MIIKVEMGEGVVAVSPHIITSIGIGSCMTVALYDAKRKIGGLAHIMLPESTKSKVNSEQYIVNRNKTGDIHYSLFTNDSSLVFQFADTALPALLEEMRKLGCARQNIAARIAGGAKMFPSYADSETGVGEQNIRSVKRSLEKAGIPLKGSDTGGRHGRNIEFHLDTGRVVVRCFEKEDREI